LQWPLGFGLASSPPEAERILFQQHVEVGTMMSSLFLKFRTTLLALTALAISASINPAAQAQEEKSALASIQQRGLLKVALYKNFPPFSDQDKGVDVDIAAALATKLGVKMTVLWFEAGENMDDDLRNMVWKGHYLGYGPADVMLHVPIDRNYMAKVDKVKFFAPYQRERYAVARNLEMLPSLESFEPFEKLSMAVEGNSLAANLMLSMDSGRYTKTMRIFKTTAESIAALKAGTVAAVVAQSGELEGGIHGDARFGIDLPPNPILQTRQWAVGLAVKAGHDDLANALQTAMNDLMADGTIKEIMKKHGVTHRQP
jgi:ABC-type amino acid transport substrate-binding protein